MYLAIEIFVAIILICFAYISTVCYFQKKPIKSIGKESLLPNSRNRKLFLIGIFIVAIAFVLVFQFVYGSKTLIHKIKLMTLLLLMAPLGAIDFRVKKIPNKFIIIALVLRAIIAVFELIISPATGLAILKDSLIGALIIGAFFFIFALVIKNSLGMGDVKLFAVMGLYQGLAGAINSVFFSLVATFLVAIALLITKKRTKNDEIPFAPSIFVGTFVGMLLAGI